MRLCYTCSLLPLDVCDVRKQHNLLPVTTILSERACLHNVESVLLMLSVYTLICGSETWGQGLNIYFWVEK